MRPDSVFPETHSIPFPHILYPRWIDNFEPKYVVAFPDGEMIITPAADYRRAHPGSQQLFPDLIRVGSRRWFLQTGLAGIAGLSLPDLLRCRAQAAANRCHGRALRTAIPHEEMAAP